MRFLPLLAHTPSVLLSFPPPSLPLFSPSLPLPQVRVRENAESIAFYSGDTREAELAGGRLARVIAIAFAKAGRQGGRGVPERFRWWAFAGRQRRALPAD